VRVFVGAYCVLQSVYIANVEGDPTLDVPCTDDDPCIQPGTPSGHSIFDGCYPPSNVLDVPGWLGYGACVVVAGFTNTLSAIWSIPGAIVNGDLGNLSGILDPLGDILTSLFVPTTLGDTWADFWAELSDRVPFGWVSQGYDAVTAVADAAGPAMVWSYTIADNEVPIPVGELAAAAEPYRGWFAAIIVAGTVLTVWRSVSGSDAPQQLSGNL
jgi:hypothetical protein